MGGTRRLGRHHAPGHWDARSHWPSGDSSRSTPSTCMCPPGMSSPSWVHRAPARAPCCDSWPDCCHRRRQRRGRRCPRQLSDAHRARLPGSHASCPGGPRWTTSATPGARRSAASGEREARARELMTLMGLDGFETASPAQLSGGMAQRVALARALTLELPAPLLDEPFGALDALTRYSIGCRVARHPGRPGATIIVVTDIRRSSRTGSWCSPSGRGRIVADVPVDLPLPRAWAAIDEAASSRAAHAVRATPRVPCPRRWRLLARGGGGCRIGRLMRDVLAVIALVLLLLGLAGHRWARLPPVRAAGAARGRRTLVEGRQRRDAP